MTSATAPLPSSPTDLEEALRRCESEAIHQLGRIQSHGVMLVLDSGPQRQVLQVSENIQDYFAASAADCLGRPLADLLGQDQALQLEPLLAQLPEADADQGPSRSILLHSVFPDHFLDLQVHAHRSDALVVLEMVPIEDPGQLTRRNEEQMSQFLGGIWKLTNQSDALAYFHEAAALVRQLTGFDRAMVYRFDPNWEGEVIAESSNETLPSYLGIRFPAGDIPPQARRLYTRNLVRMVADCEAPTVVLQPALNPLTGAPLDMSHSRLRGFSPVHIEYLRNMDVRASLSVSLLRGGRLWGLIACHSRDARQVPSQVIEMLELLSKTISMWLTALESRERKELGTRLSGMLSSLLKGLSYEESQQHILERLKEDLFGLLDVGGVVIISAGYRLALGKTPTGAHLDQLLAWLEAQPPAEVLHSNQLSTLLPAAAEYADRAAGLLVTPFHDGPRNCVLWFRPEKIRQVHWAGSPEKTVVKDRDQGLRISPRTSFATWVETWRGRSEFWSEQEIEAAETVSYAISLALARKDSVTGLPNRSVIADRVRQAIARAARVGKQIALIFIDLDKFKPINDTYGHAIGDEYLRNVGERLRHSTRAEDSVARWGGDEFVILMEDWKDFSTCLQSVERLYQALHQPLDMCGQIHMVSASIGIAAYPMHAADVEELLVRADAAMYQAKQAGGDRYVVYGDEGR